MDGRERAGLDRRSPSRYARARGRAAAGVDCAVPARLGSGCLIYWSLAAPRRFSLLTAFWMGVALDTLSGALLGQHALALLVVVYAAERFYLRVRMFPVSQLAVTVLILLATYEFILFWVDGIAGRTVPLIERWAPPLTGTLVWLVMVSLFAQPRRDARARI